MDHRAESDIADPWADDVLNRHVIARMLEQYSTNYVRQDPKRSLTIALDGRWGSGKTFFVERWKQQLNQSGQGVLVFNAWEHDSATDPSLAFMGELRAQFDEYAARTIAPGHTGKVLDNKIRAGLLALKESAKPVARFLASALVKQLAGTTIANLCAADEGVSTGSDDSLGKQATDKAIDAYLDQLIEDQARSQRSVRKFRDDLADLVALLIQGKAISGPMFVLIDELDRCRPSFAIQLLEGLKHIFNVPKVVFVIATNIEQLAASVQAVYGTNFNGREYLGRFYDLEIRLPLPSSYEFAEILTTRHPLDPSKEHDFGNYSAAHSATSDPCLRTWRAMAEASSLTLRQQEQAYLTFVLASGSWPQGFKVPGLWLMFLCCLHKGSPEAFEDLNFYPHNFATIEAFSERLKQAGWKDFQVQALQPYAEREPLRLSSVLHPYFALSLLDDYIAATTAEKNLQPRYSEVGGFIFGASRTLRGRCVLHAAFSLVSTAGLVVPDHHTA